LLELVYRFDSTEFRQDDVGQVPVDVAADGKPAIAAYLSIIQRWRREAIAEVLGVQESTVRQYIQEFGDQIR